MSTPPRRRRPDSRNANSEGGGWLPTIAMGLGVVVAGLGIGALVAVLMQRSSGKLAPLSNPVAVATSPASPAKPLPRPPLVIATIAPPHSYLSPSAVPSPEPSESEASSEAASPETSVSPAPIASASTALQRTAAPRPAPSRLVAAVVVPLASAAPVGGERAAAQPRISRVPTAEPTSAATAQPTPAPATAAPPVSSGSTAPAAAPVTAAAESAYDEHASAVVRRYVDALIRGDDKTAYSALGGGGGTLSEQSFIDPSARIVSLKVTRIDASNASVGCEIAASKGHYYATYHVTAASSGPYISEHDYIKV